MAGVITGVGARDGTTVGIMAATMILTIDTDMVVPGPLSVKTSSEIGISTQLPLADQSCSQWRRLVLTSFFENPLPLP